MHIHIWKKNPLSRSFTAFRESLRVSRLPCLGHYFLSIYFLWKRVFFKCSYSKLSGIILRRWSTAQDMFEVAFRRVFGCRFRHMDGLLRVIGKRHQCYLPTWHSPETFEASASITRSSSDCHLRLVQRSWFPKKWQLFFNHQAWNEMSSHFDSKLVLLHIA